MTDRVDDEMLMALADDELDAAAAAELRARIDRDPELARRYATFRRSAEAVRESFAATLAESPPASLVAAIETHGRRQARSIPLANLPLAASIALLAGVAGYFLGSPDTPPGADPIVALDETFASLAGSPAGMVVDLADGRRGVVLESYDTAIGPCRLAQIREGDGDALEVLGCRKSDSWRTTLIVPDASGEAFRPAEGPTSEAIRLFLGAAEASPPLDPAAEAERIRTDWSERLDGSD